MTLQNNMEMVMAGCELLLGNDFFAAGFKGGRRRSEGPSYQ